VRDVNEEEEQAEEDETLAAKEEEEGVAEEDEDAIEEETEGDNESPKDGCTTGSAELCGRITCRRAVSRQVSSLTCDCCSRCANYTQDTEGAFHKGS
jgi:hypothetical protein